MIRSLLIFFGLVLVCLVGWWTQDLRRQIEQKQARIAHLEQNLAQREAPAPAPVAAVLPTTLRMPPKDLQAALELELKKLEAMKRTEPGGEAGAGDPAIESHISEDRVAIAKLEGDLNALGQDSKVVNERSHEYRHAQEQKLKLQKAEVVNQITLVNNSLGEIKSQIQAANQDRRDPNRAGKVQQLKAQSDSLRQQRTQLAAQNHGLDVQMKETTQAITGEVALEQNEVASDRNATMRELNRLRADLEHWTKLKNAQLSKNEGMKQARKTYDQAIAQENLKIKSLEAEIESAKAHPQ